jgi:hypothetical protein
MRRWRTTSRWRDIFDLSFFPFGVLMTKGEKRVIFLYIIVILVCGRWLYYGQENLLCVACKTLMACITFILIMLSIYVWMIIMPIYLSCMFMK